MKKYKCLRCGHTWIPRIDNVVLCPWCKSKYWNEDREEKELRIQKNNEIYFKIIQKSNKENLL